MRRLIGERPGVLGAYVLVVASMVAGFMYVQHNRDVDQARLCRLSDKRWITQHDVIGTVTEPVLIPDSQSGDVALAERVRVRNLQLAGQRARLFFELGPEPQC